MTINLFYDIPNSILMLLFIVVLVSMSIIGLFIFTIATSNNFMRTFDDTNTGLYISIVAVAIGILYAFIISDEWQKYHEADNNLTQEANTLYLLAQTLDSMPGTEQSITFLIQYVCSIINIEFPAMKLGQLPSDNQNLFNLQVSIYDYIPTSAHDSILYAKAVDLMNQAVFLRNQRLETSVKGIPNELWWMLIFGFIITAIMSWFLKGNILYRIVMNAFVVSIYAALLFLATALDFPFRGDFSLTTAPFDFIIQRFGVNCSDYTS